MKIKLLVPRGEPKFSCLLAHCKFVNAETGQDVLGGNFRNVELHFPFADGGPNVISATVEISLAEIETVPPEQMEEVFPGWLRTASVTLRTPSPEPGPAAEPAAGNAAANGAAGAAAASDSGLG